MSDSWYRRPNPGKFSGGNTWTKGRYTIQKSGKTFYLLAEPGFMLPPLGIGVFDSLAKAKAAAK